MLELQEIMEEEITETTVFGPTKSITVYGVRILANIEDLEYRLNLYFQFCELAQALYVLKNVHL